MKNTELFAARERTRLIVPPVPDGGAEEPRSCVATSASYEAVHVTDSDRRDHDDRAEPATVHLDQGDKPFVPREQPRFPTSVLGPTMNSVPGMCCQPMTRPPTGACTRW